MSTETGGMVTPDMFHMAIIKAFLGREPDGLDVIPISKLRKKAVAIYNNRDGLPFLSQVKIVWGDREIKIDDFRIAFFEIKDKVFGTIRGERDSDGTEQDATD